MTLRTGRWLSLASICWLVAACVGGGETGSARQFGNHDPGPHLFSGELQISGMHRRENRSEQRSLSFVHDSWSPTGVVRLDQPVEAMPTSQLERVPIAQLAPERERAAVIDSATSAHLFSKGAPRATPSPFRLASVSVKASQPESGKLQPAAVQPVAPLDEAAADGRLGNLASRGSLLRPAAVQSVTPQPSAQVVERLPRIAGPSAPLQPAEVFSLSRPDFFAEEIQLTGLDQRLPQPANRLQPTEIEPAAAASLAESVESSFQLAMLQQPLPAPGAPLQPTEVLPIPIPDSPAAPRIPALDQDRPIAALTTNVAPTSGRLPQDYAVERFRGDYPPWAARGYADNVYFWDAPAMCYGGLRYEEVNLERYGYGCCHVLQPFVSAAHFAGSTLALPYNITNRPPWECIYPLGHYRPGSPVPYRKIWPEWNPVAAAAQCGTIAGLILLIP